MGLGWKICMDVIRCMEFFGCTIWFLWVCRTVEDCQVASSEPSAGLGLNEHWE